MTAQIQESQGGYKMEITSLTEIVLATGAVGTAAMGIVEGFKTTRLPPIGFWKLRQELGWASDALIISYGVKYEDMLSSMFRSARGSGELPRILRQGVRIGLTEQTAQIMAQTVGVADPDKLSAVAKKLVAGTDISNMPIERNLLGRFEMAVDARIDAALAMADRAYKNGLRLRAFVVSLVLALIAARLMYIPDPKTPEAGFLSSDLFVLALIVGLTAVPIAPIAKDVAKGFQSLAKALGTRK
jgi:hypothetical protein